MIECVSTTWKRESPDLPGPCKVSRLIGPVGLGQLNVTPLDNSHVARCFQGNVSDSLYLLIEKISQPRPVPPNVSSAVGLVLKRTP